jgi:anti-anti-sigma regulatory factor
VSFSLVNRQGTLVLTLEGTVTIRHAGDLAAKLGEDLEDGMPVAVDTGGLEDIDTCVLQLLCSLRKAAASLSCESPSEAFVGQVDRCGLRRELLGGREGV